MSNALIQSGSSPNKHYGYVYLITNLINSKKYIGQTTVGIAERWNGHIGKAKEGAKTVLHSAIRKYGIDSFSIEQLATAWNQEVLDYLEDYFMIIYSSQEKQFGYNRRNGGSHGQHSLEAIQKMKKPKSEIAKLNMSLNHANISGKNNPNFGKHHSEKTRKKMSKPRLHGWMLSAETKAKMCKPKSEEHKRKLAIHLDRVRKLDKRDILGRLCK